MERDAYILGTDASEAERLRSQHEVWLPQAEAVWDRAGIGPGSTVLDLGCGPGHTTMELARRVTATGRVVACDRSAAFLERVRARCGAAGVTHVATCHGPVEELALAAASADAAYARWLFCWLPDPRRALTHVARVVRPGGVIVLQEYLDWGAMSLLPGAPAFDSAVRACMASFAATGAEIDVGRQLPELAHDVGLDVVEVRPIARVGGVGSAEWQWLGAFLHGYLPRVVANGFLDAEGLARFEQAWRDAAEARAHIAAPTMLDIVLRRSQP